MKKARLVLILSLIVALMLASCAGQSTVSDTESTNGTESANATETQEPATEIANTGDFSLTGDGVERSGNIYTITAAGEYTAQGKLDEGQIIINAGEEDKVILHLSGATIASSELCPVLVLSSGKTDIEAKKDTYNYIYDRRESAESDPDDLSDENYDGAIYAQCDLKISGKGHLAIEAGYDNGIKTKDDLEIANVELEVKAAGNALKGNDSVTVESGIIKLTSTGADAIKTSNSDLSSKENQKGTVSILGGVIDIYSACDGISAAYNVEISSGEEEPEINIYTSTYANLEGSEGTTDRYLIVPTSIYSDSYDYYAYLYNETSDDGLWKKCEFDTMVYSGRNASYYGLKYKSSDEYNSIIFLSVKSGQTPSVSNYEAKTDGEAVNSSMNAYLITSVSSGEISGDWVQLSDGGDNANKTTYSSKGIKAENEIIITAGEISIYSKDDAIHANGGETLENGSRGLGCVNFVGGSLAVTASDDGIHADGTVTISGGKVDIKESHEGIEGNIVSILGGTVYIYGEDDGINAAKGDQTPCVNIGGGYLDVTTPSGDTDAIDSNGNIVMDGGTAVIKGGAQMGGMAGSVDTDGTVTVTGGTIIAIGGICETPSSGSVNTYISSTLSFQEGSYTITGPEGEAIISFELASSYTGCWISSGSIEIGKTYTINRNGSSQSTWTQSSAIEGSSGNSGFGGFGGFGGRP